MDKYNVKELKKKCKEKRLKKYSKLKKKELINLLGGSGNIKSCHIKDNDFEDCSRLFIKKDFIRKYHCRFVIHNEKLSKCIKKNNLKKYEKMGYELKKYKDIKKKISKKVKIPKLEKKQLVSDLKRYLNDDKIKIRVNTNIEDISILKNEKNFLTRFPNNKKMYNIIKSIISPGFHNDVTISTFKENDFVKSIFQNTKNQNYVMCNVDVRNIIIDIKTLKLNEYDLSVTLYLKGKLNCAKVGKKGIENVSRNVKNNYIKIKLLKNDELEIIYN